MIIFDYCNYSVGGEEFSFFMAGRNKAQRSDCMELPTPSDDEGERRVFRQVEAVTALRFVPACHRKFFTTTE
jgi:hypothetical protein